MNYLKPVMARAVLSAITAIVASAATAQTAPTLVAGGEDMGAPLIGSEIALFPAADGTASYASVGSGKGQMAFLYNDATQFALVSGTIVDFVGSGAALSPSQIYAYASSSLGTTSTGGGPLIQIPYFVTPITIPLVNAPAGTGPKTTTGQTNSVALNDNDLCGIFSGKLTDWSQVTNPDNGSLYAAGPITVVVRADGSGTTDLLTRHLAASGVCTTGTGGNSNIAFVETQTFQATLFPSGLPTNFVEATGSGGVVTALKNLGTAAGVGYLSPDYTNTLLAPSSAPAVTNALAVASLRNTSTGADVVPTYAAATTALGTVTPPSPANASNQTLWVPNSANPSVGYPVSGTNQIIVSQCYANHNNSPTVAASVVDFLTLHYTNASYADMIHGNGFNTLSSQYIIAITDTFLKQLRGQGSLNIGNTTVCSAVAGR